MSAIALRRMRIWLLFLTLVTVIIVTAQYAYAYDSRKNSYYLPPLALVWQDWGEIIAVVILFLSYIYAFKGPHKLHKYLRALLMLIPAVLILYINLDFLAKYLRNTSTRTGLRFQCNEPDCYLTWTLVFLSIVLGFFVLIEVGMTLAWGPMVKPHQYGMHGYAQDANVIIVSPDQPQPQAFYPLHQYQQQLQQNQSVALNPNPLYQPQQQYPGQQGFAQTVPVPFSSGVYPQSPIATTGYQSPPAPPTGGAQVSTGPQYYPPQPATQ
ncbi:hypothetical protein BGX23_011429 [Mortierella sp. AD031]|nr:hypothetical protein BGX23_011429 [Mortierella sp. AD031]